MERMESMERTLSMERTQLGGGDGQGRRTGKKSLTTKSPAMKKLDAACSTGKQQQGEGATAGFSFKLKLYIDTRCATGSVTIATTNHH